MASVEGLDLDSDNFLAGQRAARALIAIGLAERELGAQDQTPWKQYPGTNGRLLYVPGRPVIRGIVHHGSMIPRDGEDIETYESDDPAFVSMYSFTHGKVGHMVLKVITPPTPELTMDRLVIPINERALAKEFALVQFQPVRTNIATPDIVA